MIYGGHGGGSSDPFGGSPFGGSPTGGAPGYGSGPPSYGPPSYGPPAPGQPGAPFNTPSSPFGGGGSPFGPGGGGFGGSPPRSEPNTLATLSIVFAFVFAPAGAVLGHAALHQIRQRNQRDQRSRDRAVVGLALSYLIIVVAIIALVVWLIGGGDDSDTTPVTSTTDTTITTTKAAPPKTTVVTAPPTERPTVRVEQLRVGDCVEVQQNERVPGDPDSSYIYIYRTPCQVRDGVARVDQIVSNEQQCGTSLILRNSAHTIFACVSDFKG